MFANRKLIVSFFFSFLGILLSLIYFCFTTLWIADEQELLRLSSHQLIASQSLATATNRKMKEAVDCIILGEEEMEEFEKANLEIDKSLKLLQKFNSLEIEKTGNESEKAEKQRLNLMKVKLEEINQKICSLVDHRAKHGEGNIKNLLLEIEETVESKFDNELVPMIQYEIEEESKQMRSREARLKNYISQFGVLAISGSFFIFAITILVSFFLSRELTQSREQTNMLRSYQSHIENILKTDNVKPGDLSVKT